MKLKKAIAILLSVALMSSSLGVIAYADTDENKQEMQEGQKTEDPDVEIKDTDAEIKDPDAEIKDPEIKDPEVEIKDPEVDPEQKLPEIELEIEEEAPEKALEKTVVAAEDYNKAKDYKLIITAVSPIDDYEAQNYIGTLRLPDGTFLTYDNYEETYSIILNELPDEELVITQDEEELVSGYKQGVLTIDKETLKEGDNNLEIELQPMLTFAASVPVADLKADKYYLKVVFKNSEDDKNIREDVEFNIYKNDLIMNNIGDPYVTENTGACIVELEMDPIPTDVYRIELVEEVSGFENKNDPASMSIMGNQFKPANKGKTKNFIVRLNKLDTTILRVVFRDISDSRITEKIEFYVTGVSGIDPAVPQSTNTNGVWTFDFSPNYGAHGNVLGFSQEDSQTIINYNGLDYLLASPLTIAKTQIPDSKKTYTIVLRPVVLYDATVGFETDGTPPVALPQRPITIINAIDSTTVYTGDGVTPAIKLPEGTYTINYLDDDGNPQTETLIVDPALINAVTITIKVPVALYEATVGFETDETPPVALPQRPITITNASSTVVYTGNGVAPVIKLPEGTYTINYLDDYGNPQTETLIVDNTPVTNVVTIIVPVAVALYEATVEFETDGTPPVALPQRPITITNASSTVVYTGDGVAPVIKLPEGTYTINYLDDYGNPQTETLIVDNTPVTNVVTIIVPVAVALYEATVEFETDGTPPVALPQRPITITNASSTVVYTGNGVAPVIKLPEGTYTINYLDDYGNPQTEALTVDPILSNAVTITVPVVIGYDVTVEFVTDETPPVALPQRPITITNASSTVVYTGDGAIPAIKLPAGTYTINYLDDDGNPQTEALTVDPILSNAVTITVPVVIGYDVTVEFVTDATPSVALPQRPITITNASNTVVYTGNGVAPIINLPAGTYTINYLDDDNRAQTKPLTVEPPPILNKATIRVPAKTVAPVVNPTTGGGGGTEPGSGKGVAGQHGFMPSNPSGTTNPPIVIIPEEETPGGSIDEPATQKQPFTDVPSTHWANQAVNYLFDKSIVVGIGNNLFGVNDQVTRAQFALMVNKALELSKGDTPLTFTDVNSQDWFYGAVDILSSNGIITGFEDGTFKPNQNITREQMAFIIYKAILTKGTTYQTIRTDQPKDFDEVSDYAKEAVEFLYQKGIVNGVGDGYFVPKGTVTRAESAVIIYKTITSK